MKWVGLSPTGVPGEPLLRARNVHFSIDGVPILVDVDFELCAGEFVGLIGPNGAGKSTLLKVVSGLWPGADGDIELLGRPLRSYQAREIARLVAHVPQSTRADVAFSAWEVVLMGRSPHQGRFQVETIHDRAVAEHAMRTTDTLHLADRLLPSLSGGERQGVIIARALAQQPRILLLDEPTNNLDVRHQINMLCMVQRLAHDEGLGVVAAIHDLEVAARFCDRLVMLLDGRTVADGPPEAVLTPQRLAQVFNIHAQVYRDPFTGKLALSVQGALPSEEALAS